MNEGTQETGKSVKATSRPKYVVGMDVHSRKLAIFVWEREDPWNPALHLEKPKSDISEVKRYCRENVPLESITIIEASMNSAMVRRTLDEIGFRAEIVRSDAIAGKRRRRKVCDIDDARTPANAAGRHRKGMIT